jgi:hypothetical protein
LGAKNANCALQIVQKWHHWRLSRTIRTARMTGCAEQ